MRILAFIISTALVATALAQAPAGFQPPKEVAPGVFELGTIRLDKNASTVTFPAKINMVDGLIEYILVTSKGATHESVLITEVSPQNVHMAMLLLGAKGMSIADGAPPLGQIDAEYLAKAPKLDGDRIFLTCKWKDADGKEQASPIERWIIRREAQGRKSPKEIQAEDGPWLYTGSFMHEGRFTAEALGVFGSVVTFPSALINNPRKGANDDHMWFVKQSAIPPVGTPVELTIKLEPAKATEPKPAK